MNSFSFNPIGWLRSPYIDKFGTPRQGRVAPSSEAHIEFVPGAPVEAWLEGLEGFSHAWLITVFHQHLAEEVPAKVHPPRLAGKSVGVLASRSPHRPNPIGLTLVEVKAIKERKLFVGGVDLIDGTPILDIKPFIPESDSPPQAHAGWVEEHPWPPLSIEWSESAKKGLDRVYQLHAPPIELEQFQRVVNETLSADPRAVADRDKTQTESGEPRWFWLRLYDVDCGFYFTPQGITVGQVRFALRSPLFQRFENPTE